MRRDDKGRTPCCLREGSAHRPAHKEAMCRGPIARGERQGTRMGTIFRANSVRECESRLQNPTLGEVAPDTY